LDVVRLLISLELSFKEIFPEQVDALLLRENIEDNILGGQSWGLKASAIMIEVIANELRVVQEDLSIVKEVGVDLKLPDIESFKFILPWFHILPVEDPLLKQVVEGVPQLDI
jgi:hypothetical protein